jgi:hypothetical protein
VLSSLSAREKLMQLSRQREEARRDAERDARRRPVPDEDEDDLCKTGDVFAYCVREFEEYELRTGARHRVAVDRGGPSRRSGLPADGVDYATLSISERSARTNGYRGDITLLQARHRHGVYELLYEAGKETFASLGDLRARLVEILVGLDDEALAGVFAYIRGVHPGH